MKVTEIAAFDIERMLRETKLPRQRVAEALDLKGEFKEIKAKLAACETIAEAIEVYRDTPSGSEAEELAVERINELAPAELTTCKTTAEAMKVYRNTPDGSEAGKLAVERALELAQTTAEAMKVYRNTPDESEAEKLAIKKIATFYGYRG